MRILFMGDDHPLLTSGHRAAALRRLGHEVTVLNPSAALPRSRMVGGLRTRVGLWPFVPWVNAVLRRKIDGAQFDLTWVDCGAELGPRFHQWLRQRCRFIINYNCDDPFGGRDGRKWDLYRSSLKYLDLAVVVRPPNVEEARSAGARQVIRVFMSYDPVAHSALPLDEKERLAWGSEVVFVGSWMPERGPFMVKLLEAGVPLTIRGDHWERAPEYGRLRTAIRGRAVYGPDYVRAIQCAKVALGLLSKGNRDQHTQRSVEVPYIGTPFCCERTDEHQAMFCEGTEAVMWSTASECAAACHRMLGDHQECQNIASAAKKRITEMGLDNDTLLKMLISKFDVAEPAD